MMVNAVRRHHEGAVFDEVSVTVAEERNKYERRTAARPQARRRARGQGARRPGGAAGGAGAAGARPCGSARCSSGASMPAAAARYGDEVALPARPSTARGRSTRTRCSRRMAPQERAAEQAVLAEALANPGAPFALEVHACRVSTARRRVVAASGQSFFDEDGSLLRSSSASCRTSPRLESRARAPPKTARCSPSRWWASSATTCATRCPPS